MRLHIYIDQSSPYLANFTQILMPWETPIPKLLILQTRHRKAHGFSAEAKFDCVHGYICPTKLNSLHK